MTLLLFGLIFKFARLNWKFLYHPYVIHEGDTDARGIVSLLDLVWEIPM
jgi:hypothetical protein